MTLSIYTVYSPKIYTPVGSANCFRTNYYSHLSGPVNELLHNATSRENLALPLYFKPSQCGYVYKNSI